MEYNLERLEELARLIHNVQRVKRISRRPDEKEKTNTAEHTFELAILCWFISSTHAPSLNKEKIFKFALAHDVVEAYAGDTPFHDEEGKKTKVARETAALERIEKEFLDFPELAQIIHEYESRNSPEAKFVYAIDKLTDPLNASMEETQSLWKDYNIPFDASLQQKGEKIGESDVVVPYWDLLVKKLQAKKNFYAPEE